MNRRTALGALGVTVLGGLTACTSRRTPESGYGHSPIVLAAGSTVGVYYQYGSAIAELARDQLGPITLESTTGSVDNLHRLASGEATLAFSAADAATAALQGDSPLNQAIPVTAIAKLYDDYIHLVVPASSGITGIDDLRGRRVSVGATGSGTVLITDRLLAASGIDGHTNIVRRQLSLDDSAAALDKGEIDAFFWSGGLPTVAVTRLAGHRAVRLVDLRDAASKLRSTFGTCYRIGVIPRNTYADQTKQVPTLAVPNLLVTLASQPVVGVANTTDFIFGNAAQLGTHVPVAAQLDAHTAVFTEPVPLHPGALSYYRSGRSH